MPPEINTAYPSQYETEVLLRDGSRILLRPIRVEDTERWLAFVRRLSRRTKYLRFHHMPEEMSRDDAVRFCTVDYVNTFAFVAEVLKEQRRDIVAIGRYYRLPNKHSAEVAFTIEDAIRRVIPVFQRHQKPLLACFMGQRGVQGKLGSGGNFVPCYLFPEDTISALAKAVSYGELARKPKGTIAKIGGINRRRARKIVNMAMTRSTQRPLWLSAQEISELLNCYGIRTVETLVAQTAVEAAALASGIGFPVVVKLNSSTIVHKTDVGGVILDLDSENEVKQAFADIKARLTEISREHEMEGVTVQRMVKGGVEAIVGVTQDPSFGPLIMFGLGGIYAELLNDVALRLHPLTDLDARELMSSIKMAKLLEGFRGSPPSDRRALEDLLLRLSALVEDMPEIAELDLNPVKVMPQGEGYWVVDARIMVR